MAGWLEGCPGVRVLAHHADGKLVEYPVINPQANSARGEVVSLGAVVAVHTDKVTEAGDPDTPTVVRRMVKGWFHHVFGGLSVDDGFALRRHRTSVNLHIGAK